MDLENNMDLELIDFDKIYNGGIDFNRIQYFSHWESSYNELLANFIKSNFIDREDFLDEQGYYIVIGLELVLNQPPTNQLGISQEKADEILVTLNEFDNQNFEIVFETLEVANTDNVIAGLYFNTPYRSPADTQKEENPRLIELLTQFNNQELSRSNLMAALSLHNRENFAKVYLNPAIEKGFISKTILDKPNSPKQKYRLTQQGKEFLASKVTSKDITE